MQLSILEIKWLGKNFGVNNWKLLKWIRYKLQNYKEKLKLIIYGFNSRLNPVWERELVNLHVKNIYTGVWKDSDGKCRKTKK